MPTDASLFVDLQQALETERIRVRQLEARNDRMTFTVDHEHGWEFSARRQETTRKQEHMQAKCTPFVGSNTPGDSKSRNVPQPVRTATTQQSMPALACSAASPCPERRCLTSGHPFSGSAERRTQSIYNSTGVTSVFHAYSHRKSQGSKVHRKGTPTAAVVRQLGRPTLMNHHVQKNPSEFQQELSRAAQYGYSDAGVAKLMQQYSSLLKELGIEHSSPSCTDIPSEQVKPSGTHPCAQSEMPHHATQTNAIDLEEATHIDDGSDVKTGRGQPAPVHFGLSGILAHSQMERHRRPKLRPSPSRSTSMPTQGSGFGLSAILKGARTSIGKGSAK